MNDGRDRNDFAFGAGGRRSLVAAGRRANAVLHLPGDAGGQHDTGSAAQSHQPRRTLATNRHAAQRGDPGRLHRRTRQRQDGRIELGVGLGLGQLAVQARQIRLLPGEEGFEFALVGSFLSHSANLARIFANA
ncbi:hypothetical protein [Tahibacter amnicola]|uniref:Uncharacterized protein n=1 Tax=Tahibacter amnicola TaxID=2976241 RepID=A0ABY6BKP9_9GAMM|nr:hypothetical protein [Tahibacter amnicola]UXI69988.1 hypothetical protein N4264_10285 [Tahibacter amnicola]